MRHARGDNETDCDSLHGRLLLSTKCSIHRAWLRGVRQEKRNCSSELHVAGWTAATKVKGKMTKRTRANMTREKDTRERLAIGPGRVRLAAC